MDPAIFMKHGDIDDQDVKIKLEFIRDFRNVLGLLSDIEESEYVDQLERDISRQRVAKLATMNF